MADTEAPGRGEGAGTTPRAEVLGPLCDALFESRQRWHDLFSLAADLAFELDENGRFSFLFPDMVLGWQAATLLGQPAELLLASTRPAEEFNPFRPIVSHRQKPVWVRRADGSAACLSFTTAPLFDSLGKSIGCRGVATDVTEQVSREQTSAAAHRRGAVLDNILWAMRREVLAPRMMQSVLESLMQAMGAEGAAVLDLDDGAPAEAATAPAVMYQAGGGGSSAALAAAGRLLQGAAGQSAAVLGTDGRKIIGTRCSTRFGEPCGVVLWRTPGSRSWDPDDQLLVRAAGGIVRVVLEHVATQREMSREAHTDPLTGLLNRRAFLDEMARRIERLEYEELPGTLMFVDLDRFKELNDALGHEVGDAALLATAALLREVFRPTDLIARLGGDEFAVWLDGADHLAAAERAEQLRWAGPERLAPLGGGRGIALTMSIGIATREADARESVRELMRRADAAMYAVKREGRGHWRVAHREPPA